LIEVPDYLVNPFDLLIADHSTHFSAATLSRVVERAGYEILYAGTEWVPKELTLLARKTGAARAGGPPPVAQASTLAGAGGRVEWLAAVASAARAMAAGGRFGIFGSSNAATWLFTELDGRVDFFVDEDLRCAGRPYLDRPVYLPRDIPAGSGVYLALAPLIGTGVKERLDAMCPGCEFRLTPALPDALF
jgi:hypothetical protein